jgi:hypothetical protein
MYAMSKSAEVFLAQIERTSFFCFSQKTDMAESRKNLQIKNLSDFSKRFLSNSMFLKV